MKKRKIILPSLLILIAATGFMKDDLCIGSDTVLNSCIFEEKN